MLEAKSQMDIRAAVSSEADKLSAIAFAAKAHWGYSTEALQSWAGELQISAADVATKPAYVGVINGDIVGFYCLRPSAQVWDLEHLWVTPQRIRQGIGRTLLVHALEVARRGGAVSVTTDADPNAAAFYLSQGAIRRGDVPAPIPGDSNRVRPQFVLFS